jgi:hypothetical protein
MVRIAEEELERARKEAIKIYFNGLRLPTGQSASEPKLLKSEAGVLTKQPEYLLLGSLLSLINNYFN